MVESRLSQAIKKSFAAGIGFCGTIGDLPTVQQLAGVLVCFINALLAAAGGIALLVVAFGGVKYIMSGGDEKALKSAKGTITWGIGGLVLILLSVLAVSIIGSIIGVKDITTVKIPFLKP